MFKLNEPIRKTVRLVQFLFFAVVALMYILTIPLNLKKKIENVQRRYQNKNVKIFLYIFLFMCMLKLLCTVIMISLRASKDSNREKNSNKTK